jgi:hypothetical protein
LPSDHDGRAISIVAALAAAAGVAIWRRRRWRLRALRWLARRRGRWLAAGALAIRVGVPLALAILLVHGFTRAGETRALELGSGARATASVDARKREGQWQACGYVRLTGAYVCDGLVTAYDATANLLNDAAPSWGFTTPAIVASADTPDVEIRIRLRARLAGAYYAAVNGGIAELAVDGDPVRAIEREELAYLDRGERAVEIRAQVPMTAWAFTFVREDTLVPDRPFLAAPPLGPPAMVRAIR